MMWIFGKSFQTFKLVTRAKDAKISDNNLNRNIIVERDREKEKETERERN